MLLVLLSLQLASLELGVLPVVLKLEWFPDFPLERRSFKSEDVFLLIHALA